MVAETVAEAAEAAEAGGAKAPAMAWTTKTAEAVAGEAFLVLVRAQPQCLLHHPLPPTFITSPSTFTTAKQLAGDPDATFSSWAPLNLQDGGGDVYAEGAW